MAEASDETQKSDNGMLKKLLWAGVAVGAAAMINAAIFQRTPPLMYRQKGGQAKWLPLPDGDIAYEVAGEGKPLLLLHAIGAGCSAFEWRHVFGPLSETRQVFAPDLLGFGKSDKPKITYTAETYLDLIADFIEQAIGQKTDIIASSLSAAFAVALAQRRPELVDKLILVCPTGLEALSAPLQPSGKAIATALSLPVLGASLYNLITSRMGLRQYLKMRVYASPEPVDDALVTHFHHAAHQPGGDRVLPYFLGGYLNCNIVDALAALPEAPKLLWGAAASETPIAQSEAFLDVRPDAQLVVLNNVGGLPHDEAPEAFLEIVTGWL
jgi:pimeloyl-ACP methyl ester carboxylesterase